MSQDLRSAYEVLGVNKASSKSDIRDAFRVRAMLTHPDQGGLEEDFLILKEAYDLLADESSQDAEVKQFYPLQIEDRLIPTESIMRYQFRGRKLSVEKLNNRGGVSIVQF